MSLKIRLARAGTKKRPVYHIVAADSRMPRDGRYIERLGHFNPLMAKDNKDRLKFDLEKVQAWMKKGALPTDRDPAAGLGFEVGRRGQMIGMDVGLENPGEMERMRAQIAKDAVGGGRGGAARADVEIEHRVDDGAGAAIAGVDDVTHRRACLVVEGLDDHPHARHLPRTPQAFSLYPLAIRRKQRVSNAAFSAMRVATPIASEPPALPVKA